MSSGYNPPSGGGGSGVGSGGTVEIPIFYDQDNTFGGAATLLVGTVNVRRGQMTTGVDRWVGGQMYVPDEHNGNAVNFRCEWQPGAAGPAQTVRFRMGIVEVVEGILLGEWVDSPVVHDHVIVEAGLETIVTDIEFINGLNAGSKYMCVLERRGGDVVDDFVGTVFVCSMSCRIPIA